MRKILGIVVLSSFLFSCLGPIKGDGVVGKIDTKIKNPNKANIFLNFFSTGNMQAGFAPTIIINDQNSFLLGDKEKIIIPVNEGPLRIKIDIPYEEITWSRYYHCWALGEGGKRDPRQKEFIIFNKKLVQKNNNYYFIIRPFWGYDWKTIKNCYEGHLLYTKKLKLFILSKN